MFVVYATFDQVLGTPSKKDVFSLAVYSKKKELIQDGFFIKKNLQRRGLKVQLKNTEEETNRLFKIALKLFC